MITTITKYLLTGLLFLIAGGIISSVGHDEIERELRNNLIEKEGKIEYLQRPDVIYERLVQDIWAIGNRDTVFIETFEQREINHWVPGTVFVDTVTREFSVHISVGSRVSRQNKGDE